MKFCVKILEWFSVKTANIRILEMVNRSSWDHFFRIPHLKLGFLLNFRLKQTLLGENFGAEKGRRAQKWHLNFFPIKPPNRVWLSWNSFWMSNTLPATGFKLIFYKTFFFRFDISHFSFERLWDQSQIFTYWCLFWVEICQ